MRLVTFATSTGPRAGVLEAGLVRSFRPGVTVLDVVREGLPVDLARWLPNGEEPAQPLGDLHVLAPLQPPTIRDFVAFEEHVEGVRRGIERAPGIPDEWYEAPTFYFSNPHSVIASGADVVRPAGSLELDFELEVGIVIGRSGSSLDSAAALQHVFGYTIFNDWSARDLQRREMKVGLGPAKGKDFASTLGPVLVTADELAHHLDGDGFLALGMWVSVNGVEIGCDLLSNMGWPIADLVAYASRDTWVHPGDLLGSGTCGAGGCLAELWGRTGERVPPALQPGDVVSMTVEGIGTIENTVVAGLPTPNVGPARVRPRIRPSSGPQHELA